MLEQRELLLENARHERNKIIAFRSAFSGEAGKLVLEYLSTFCFEFDAAFIPDSREDCYYKGRRSVIQEIREQLKKEIES